MEILQFTIKHNQLAEYDIRMRERESEVLEVDDAKPKYEKLSQHATSVFNSLGLGSARRLFPELKHWRGEALEI